MLFGDFNAIRQKGERKGRGGSRAERQNFNKFIEDQQLVEFIKEGPKYSFSNMRINLL